MSSGAIIIGAGPAGLTSAYELSKLGISSTILEADEQVGGLSRTVSYKGYRFDIGGHRFFSKVPLINELWREMLSEDFLLRPRMSRIHYRGHFFDYPLKAANALAGLGPVEAFLVMLSYSKAKLFPHAEETNLEQWVSNRFGQRLYEIFFKTYTEKVWGMPCTEISADWAAQRIKNLSLKEAVRNALFGAGKSAEGEIITTLIEQFHYPRLGPGMMWECCKELLASQGNETVHGVKVDKIRHHKGRVESVIGHKSNGERVEFDGDQFISSMPLRRLIQSLDPLPPDEVLEAANSLRYRDYLTVVLMAKREHVFPDNWIYIHSPEVKMGRIQNYKNWSPEMVPDSSRSSLGLEYFLWQKDEEWNWSNDRLIDLGIKECAQIGLVQPDEVEDGTVVRMKKAYPVYDQDYQTRIDLIRNYLETIPNLQTVGRNGLHRYNNQDHSMLTGVYAARNIVGEKNDVWAVNTEQDYHEEVREAETGRVKTMGDRAVPMPVQPATVETDALADQLIQKAFAKLDPVALGVAVGTVVGAGLLLATIVLLLKGGTFIGPRLGLLRNFLIGYDVTWLGSLVGLVEGSVGGFALGYAAASFRNWGMKAYAYMLKRRAEAQAEGKVLD
ncbi:MAG TPA: NAD(P)/FAD-dependent oxidoreductase [Blastocatellia bacterium]|nr:NAD(P)/FAD-dependent oxidoreductase [Blastocatellia bacterium]